MAARLRPVDDEPHTRLKQVSLFTPTRLAILDAIRETPGISMTDVARRLGKHPSVVYEHLHYLRQARLVLSERNGRRVALFLDGDLTEEERRTARAGPSARVLELVREGVTSPSAIGIALGVSRHSARYHLHRLAQMDLVRTVQTRVLVTVTRFTVAE